MRTGSLKDTEIAGNPNNGLPKSALLPINRCNLPASILGSLVFQQYPTQLFIDGVLQLHAQLFTTLDQIPTPEKRALNFQDYMKASFLLDNLDGAGLTPCGDQPGKNRGKADYIRLLRGWMFNADHIEGAVLKGWVESRFGLLTRFHQGLMTDYNGHPYLLFQAMRATGLYNTNALEAQLDLLYSYCQYELARREPQSHLQLYRGSNNVADYKLSTQPSTKQDEASYRIILNNLNSFTNTPEQADTFGDHILYGAIPCAKIMYFPGLLPGVLQGENEYLVLGGLYQLKRYRHL